MKSKITLDWSSCLEENIGSGGIKREEIFSLEERLSRIEQKIDEEICNKKLGFYFLPDSKEIINEIKEYVSSLPDTIQDVIVCGIGGSCLGPKAIYSALKHPYYNLLSYEQRGGRRLFFLDNVDPILNRGVFDIVKPEHTLVLVITKSGSTGETAAQLLLFCKWLKENLKDNYKEHLVFITDPTSGALKKLGDELNIKMFYIPPNVGGRFSVLSPVGLLPSALAGINIDSLLEGAYQVREKMKREKQLENPAVLFAVISYVAYRLYKLRTLVMMSYVNGLYDTVDWFRQLWAESLGKKYSKTKEIVYEGQLPVKALGTTDQHSQLQLYMEGPKDKLIAFLTVNERESVEIPSLFPHIEQYSYLGGHTFGELIEAERKATTCALAKEGRPSITVSLEKLDEFSLGALFFFFEYATVVMGSLLNVDPFDQPGVELGKKYTYGIMGRKNFEDYKNEFEESSKRYFERAISVIL